MNGGRSDLITINILVFRFARRVLPVGNISPFQFSGILRQGPLLLLVLCAAGTLSDS